MRIYLENIVEHGVCVGCMRVELFVCHCNRKIQLTVHAKLMHINIESKLQFVWSLNDVSIHVSFLFTFVDS